MTAPLLFGAFHDKATSLAVLAVTFSPGTTPGVLVSVVALVAGLVCPAPARFTVVTVAEYSVPGFSPVTS